MRGGLSVITQKQREIADMQCQVIRMAQKKWNISGKQCSELFRKYQLLEFIKECYEILHVSSYQSVVNDLEDILKSKGEKLWK